MKSKICAKAAVIAMLAMLTIGVSPLALAENGATGDAEAGNVAPEVTSVTAPTVAPLVEVKFPCTVWDNNTLADIDNVQLILYTADAGVDGENHVENHYVFWFDPTDNSFYSVLGAAYIDNENSTYPNDLSAQSDNYSFAIILSGVATPITWTAIWIATDDNGLTDNKENTFTVEQYISLTIDDSKLTFSGDPGDENIEPTDQQPTVCTVTSNYVFNIQASLSDNWTGSTHGEKIPMSNTAAARDNITKEGLQPLSTTEANIWTSLEPGEGVEANIYWFLDLPVPLRDDVYTTTFYVNAA